MPAEQSSQILEQANQPPLSNCLRNYTLLHSLDLASAQKSLVVRREDGFEKRWILRCGRCNLVVAYQLDWSQFGDEAREKVGRRLDILYLLPKSTVMTEALQKGRIASEKDVSIGLAT